MEGSRRGLGPPGRMAESEPRSPARFGAEERQAASESRDGSEARLRLATVRRALLLALRPHPTDGGAGLGPLGYHSDSEIWARPGSATGPGPRDQGRRPPSELAALRKPRDPVRGRAAAAIGDSGASVRLSQGPGLGTGPESESQAHSGWIGFRPGLDFPNRVC